MKRFFIVLAFLFAPILIFAQNVITVSGVVLDETGTAVIGAGVVQKGSKTGVPTDLDGNFSIKVPSDAILDISYIGFKTQSVPVQGRTVLRIVLHQDSESLEGTVVVGYGVQKKGSVTGSVSAINSEKLMTTKSENPQNLLTGKIAGVRVWQTSSEPGSYSASMDIRGLGDPLIVIDGVTHSMSDFQRLSSNDIENISVLKDASAAIYGVRGANGVVLVTTKTGSQGTAKVSYNGSFTVQRPSGLPLLCSPYQEMTLYNERNMNAIYGGSLIYTDADFAAFESGERTATDWNGLVFSKWAPQQAHDISVSGGNEKVQYYFAGGYNYQQSFFKSGDLYYNKYNMRSNITATPLDGLKINFNVDGYVDLKHTPYKSAVNLLRNFWSMGALYPAYIDDENTKLNYDINEGYNTVAMMTSSVSGYHTYKDKGINTVANLEFDFGKYVDILQGLSLKALGGYYYSRADNEAFKKAYQMWTYNTDIGDYVLKTFAESSPSYLREDNYWFDQLQGQVVLNYDRTFGKHRVAALVGWESQKRSGRNQYGYTNLAFDSPYLTATSGENVNFGMNPDSSVFYDLVYKALISRLNYSFDGRYLLEAQFRYDGSSKFAKGHQWGFFPSFSAGWRISEEPWFKSGPLEFINNLKLRVSYGMLGDDSGVNYQWVSGYTYPSNDSAASAHDGYYEGRDPGYYFGSDYIYGIDYQAMANENITWYTSHSFDAGVDFEAWKGLLGFTFDYFYRKRTGLYAQSGEDVPTVVGSSAALENANSDANLGFDFEISHRNKIGEVSYGAKGIVTLTRSKTLKTISRQSFSNSYDEWQSSNNYRYNGVVWGYNGAGRYQNWEDIWSDKTYHGNGTLPGGYRYEDWNGDGYYNGYDAHPITLGSTPWMNFSLALDCNWRRWDANILLQGTALGSMAYEEPLYSIWGSGGGSGTYGGTLKQYWDRWHPTETGVDPYDQSLTWVKGYYGFTGDYPDASSSFNRVSTAYLRLKSVEIGYTLPEIKAFKEFSLRVYANAYNLFTLTGVKFVDPEHPDSDLGRMYPLNKTCTFGVNLTF